MTRPGPSPAEAADAAPWRALHARLGDLAAALEQAGHADAARGLRDTTAAWWAEQSAWDLRCAQVLGAHHDINNALVGVRGHAQLLMMSPVAQQPGVRERLEVMLRESARIQEAAARIRELKQSFGGPDVPARAA
jgi:nitrogen-specific signal transduction histidine kinase